MAEASGAITSPAQAQSEHLVKRGWLWKRAVGRSVIIGRKNWKLRFIESDSDAIRYYATEPFNGALSCIYWSDVVHVFDKAPADEKGLDPAYDGNGNGVAQPGKNGNSPGASPKVGFSASPNERGRGNGNGRGSTSTNNNNNNTTNSNSSFNNKSSMTSQQQQSVSEYSYDTMTNNSYSSKDRRIGGGGKKDGGDTNKGDRYGGASSSHDPRGCGSEDDDIDEDELLGEPLPQPVRNYFHRCAASGNDYTNNNAVVGGMGSSFSKQQAVASRCEAANTTREVYYFGVSFREGGKSSEKLLMFRTDCHEDHASWVRYFRRVAELYSLTDDDEDFEVKSTGVVERLSRKLRSVVSLQKQRFSMGDLDLDLSYVLPNVIAMGFPCEGREELFRNPMSHVVKFFDLYHKKQFHVINLCSERFYPQSRFGGKFDRFPFDDHNPCPMPLLYDVCEKMYDNLTPAPTVNPSTGKVVEGTNPCLTSKCVIESVYSLQNTEFPVVAVHCKAGKGRTGLVICAYLMYAGICYLPSDAMTLFAARRTKDGKGIQIPSQRRYLEYLHQSLHNYGGQIPSNVIRIRAVSINVKPKESREIGLSGITDGGEYYIRIEQRAHNHRHIPMGQTEGNCKDPLVVIHDTSKQGHFALKRKVDGMSAASADGGSQGGGGGGWSPLSALTRKKAANEEYSVRVGATLRGVTDFRVALYSLGRQQDEAVYWCSVWLHTGFMPSGTNIMHFTKFQIDDAAKDKKHNRFPQEFQMSVEFSIDGPGPTRPAPKKPIPCLDLL